MIFANAASQKRGGGREEGRGGEGQCEYLIIYLGPKPTTDESIEGLKV